MKNIIYLIIGITFFVSCKKNTNTSTTKNDRRLITDMTGRKVWIPKEPKNIIGVRAGALRMLTYVATDMICAVEQIETSRRLKGIAPYSLVNPELSKQKNIGPIHGGDAELIVKANPDIVFTSFSSAKDADALQEKIGIPVICLANAELAVQKDRWLKNIALIGEALNKKEVAEKLNKFVESSISELNRRTKQLDKKLKPKVYIGGVAMSGAHGIGSTRPFYPPFEFVNIKNVASSLAEEGKLIVKHSAFIDKEKLLLWNPDIIYIDAGGLELCKKDLSPELPLYNNLKAVKNNRMFLVYPHNAYSTNYEMVLANAWYIGKTLYPKKFEDVNFDEKLKEILKTFYRKGVNVTFFKNYFRAIDKTEFE